MVAEFHVVNSFLLPASENFQQAQMSEPFCDTCDQGFKLQGFEYQLKFFMALTHSNLLLLDKTTMGNSIAETENSSTVIEVNEIIKHRSRARLGVYTNHKKRKQKAGTLARTSTKSKDAWSEGRKMFY